MKKISVVLFNFLLAPMQDADFSIFSSSVTAPKRVKIADPIPLELSYATYPRAVTHGAKVRQASYGDVLRRARRMCHGITIRRDIS